MLDTPLEKLGLALDLFFISSFSVPLWGVSHIRAWDSNMPPNLALIVSSKKPSAPGYRGGKVEGLRSHRQLQDLSWEEVRPVERFLAWCWAKCKCVLSTKGVQAAAGSSLDRCIDQDLELCDFDELKKHPVSLSHHHCGSCKFGCLLHTSFFLGRLHALLCWRPQTSHIALLQSCESTYSRCLAGPQDRPLTVPSWHWLGPEL